jgi:hypothetical protein
VTHNTKMEASTIINTSDGNSHDFMTAHEHEINPGQCHRYFVFSQDSRVIYKGAVIYHTYVHKFLSSGF